MGAPDELPRFPCWCKATYSWGGETKKDLGFIEGDLIEALNAGDGAWWMGRLRRDPRAVGLFPSNFVQVLDESFQPAPNSRNATPPQTQQRGRQSDSLRSKSIFRKPFQAYEEIGKRESMDSIRAREGTPDSDPEKRKEKSKYRPYSSMKTAQAPTGTIKKQGGVSVVPQDDGPRIPAPPPRGGASRRSPQPPRNAPSASPTPTPGYGPGPPQAIYRAPSPQPGYRAPSPQPGYRAPSPQPGYRAPSPQPGYRAPSPQPGYRAPSPQPGYRAPSPAPSRSHSPLPATYHDGSAYPQILPASRQPSPNPYEQPLYHSRAPSPAPYEEDISSSPPPPPPAHRVAYQPSRAPSPQPDEQMHPGYSRNGSHTPMAPSPNGSHMTPSPLRAAMNDVMSSLQDMSALQQSSPAPRADSPPNIWSPDEFELVRQQSRRAQSSMGFAPHARAASSLGFATHEQYDYEDSRSKTPSLPSSRDGPPAVSNYVQRMEKQLRHAPSFSSDIPPQPPLKGAQYSSSRPTTAGSQSSSNSSGHNIHQQHPPVPPLRHRKSAFELGIGRTYTTKTNATNSTENSSATQSSNSTQMTSRSIMSGYSAGGFSATSAGSLARRKFGLGSQRGRALTDSKSTGDINSSTRSIVASDVSGSGPSYHESHASANQPLITPTADWTMDSTESAGVLGGMSAPQAKRSGFFKRMIQTAKTTARTGAANARSTIGNASQSRPGSRAGSPTKSNFGGNGPTSIAGGTAARPSTAPNGAARDMGLGGGSDWMQVRRDVNRSNSLSQRELDERAERCEMNDLPVLRPIDQLHEFVEGDEGLDGLPITEPTDFHLPNLALVDKSTRFIQNLPPMISPNSLAQSYVCRPHRSDVQRLRAIFTWVAERITWEDDFEGQIDTRRVIQTKRGCSEEISLLVRDMATAVGLHAEVVRGYLKGPGEVVDLDTVAHPNHWWNAVIVDGEWRIMDCALAGPTHPRRSAYSSASSQVADPWYFLARPMEICYTHIPLLPEQQHIVPPVEHEVLIALPCACPAYFRNTVEMADFDTSLLHLENLEMAHLHINVPEDVECVAETAARAFSRDADGDLFESGDIVTKRAFAQAEWTNGRKRYTIKALLPGDEGHGTLNIYAGKRGLMHSIKDNPHSLAVALPLSHSGQNPPYDFVTRHPTPHAQRHDLYIAQPQCAKLTMNNTFVFHIRQHPSSLSRFSPDTWGTGTRPQSPLARPGSAMSMVSMSASQSGSGSQYSDPSNTSSSMTPAQQKPVKLAIQSPSQKIIRLTRKQEFAARGGGAGREEEGGLTSSWETVIKIGERGTWRGLVLADRSARWCVFAEWECV